MNTEVGVYWIQQMLTATVVLSGPLLIAALVVGLVISIVQAATSIQEMTLSYVPKMAAIVVLLFLFIGYMLQYMITFMERIFNFIPILAH
ncbi:MAG TPA: flagellar biosynthesis protein FliQ [Balneolales bacterium]|nr:flagellar biosynthesis protein FliQ [Balneolales bacterium]